MVTELVEDLLLCLADEGAKLEPGRPEEWSIVQDPNKGFFRLRLLIPFLVDQAKQISVESIEIFSLIVLL